MPGQKSIRYFILGTTYNCAECAHDLGTSQDCKNCHRARRLAVYMQAVVDHWLAPPPPDDDGTDQFETHWRV